MSPIGNHGEMHETPMLVGIGDTVRACGGRYTVLCHIRYDYGRGIWDEATATAFRGQLSERPAGETRKIVGTRGIGEHRTRR